MRDDRERLQDIVEAIGRIEKYASRGRTVFENDELIQNWVVRYIAIIGEACRSMTPGFHDRHPEVPWDKIIGMRHILVHQYFEISVPLVWSVAEEDLKPLRGQIETILRSTEG